MTCIGWIFSLIQHLVNNTYVVFSFNTLRADLFGYFVMTLCCDSLTSCELSLFMSSTDRAVWHERKGGPSVIWPATSRRDGSGEALQRGHGSPHRHWGQEPHQHGLRAHDTAAHWEETRGGEGTARQDIKFKYSHHTVTFQVCLVVTSLSSPQGGTASIGERGAG